ncbi:hypothetical protein BGZ60DRAFT_428503 [Tricladium varicosporioides]|nr:hypothetical protein BGZ60DRAFT_428503 [Hymenoscyphus varicosporioides]
MAIHDWVKQPLDPKKFTYSHWVWLNRRRIKVGGTVNEQDFLRAYENMSTRIYQKNGQAVELLKRDPYRWDHPVYGRIRPEMVESLLEVRRVPKKRARGAPDTKRKRTQLSRVYTRKNRATSTSGFHGAAASQVVTSSFDTLKEISEAETQTQTPVYNDSIENSLQDITVSAKVVSRATRGFKLGAQIYKRWDTKKDDDEWVDIDDFEGDFEMLEDSLVWAAEDEYIFL